MKAGIKTTEFWLTALTGLSTVVGGLSGIIPPELAVKIVAVITAVYNAVRAITKAFSKDA